MSQSVLHGGNGQPKSQILNFKKYKLNSKKVKDILSFGYKKSNNYNRTLTPQQPCNGCRVNTPSKQVRFDHTNCNLAVH
jgi:hypothetical protein